jgi:predicted PurR-regulated permease PerM
MLVISIYLLIDGNRIFRWLLAFLPPQQRIKVRRASPRISKIVSRFIVGQWITSALAGVYAFLVLYLLHVPSAAILAVVAAIFDLLPILGFFLFVIPAVGMAFTISPMIGGLVALLYGAYHLLETYFIVPKVYGNQLKLSTLTVLLSCMAGWLLGGVVGAIAILPVVASYPVVEKTWLRPLLQKDTVSKHDQIETELEGAESD